MKINYIFLLIVFFGTLDLMAQPKGGPKGLAKTSTPGSFAGARSSGLGRQSSMGSFSGQKVVQPTSTRRFGDMGKLSFDKIQGGQKVSSARLGRRIGDSQFATSSKAKSSQALKKAQIDRSFGGLGQIKKRQADTTDTRRLGGQKQLDQMARKAFAGKKITTNDLQKLDPSKTFKKGTGKFARFKTAHRFNQQKQLFNKHFKGHPWRWWWRHNPYIFFTYFPLFFYRTYGYYPPIYYDFYDLYGYYPPVQYITQAAVCTRECVQNYLNTTDLSLRQVLTQCNCV